MEHFVKVYILWSNPINLILNFDFIMDVYLIGYEPERIK